MFIIEFCWLIVGEPEDEKLLLDKAGMIGYCDIILVTIY
jgi:hypothetical protein